MCGVEALVDTLAEPVPDAKDKTPLDTLSDVKAEEIKKRLKDNLAEAEAGFL